ncbi:MAG TPA: methyltransferase domain-containing protein [Streptosporangiaceae bacterium]|nr:methyltransferase domain-containing protein [Streptosporangiaceae bacterium]
MTTSAAGLAPDAAELLDRIGVAPGASVIDIGCGVLGILPRLRARVGRGRRVAGLYIEPRLLAIAAQLSARHGFAVETVRANAASSGLPPSSFDLAHERMLLLNVTSPQNFVAEMTRLARPGGVVALQEPDSAAWAIDPAASGLGAAASRGHRRLPANRSRGRRSRAGCPSVTGRFRSWCGHKSPLREIRGTSR